MACANAFAMFTAIGAVSAALVLSACGRPAPAPEPQVSVPAGDPLLAQSPLPFQAPPWDKIKDSDFAPAFDDAIKQHDVEIAAIADDSTAPTFDNVLVALEKSGQALTRVQLAFNVLSGANTDDTLQKLQE